MVLRSASPEQVHRVSFDHESNLVKNPFCGNHANLGSSVGGIVSE
jgi:hypothetical protein